MRIFLVRSMWPGLSDLALIYCIFLFILTHTLSEFDITSIVRKGYDLQDNLVGTPPVEGTFEFLTVCQLCDDTVT